MMMASSTQSITTTTPNNTVVDDCLEKNDPAVQVYVRVRPLIAEEEGHALLEYKTNDHGTCFQLKMPTNDKDKQKNPAFANAPPLRHHRGNEWKTYHGYTNILGEEYSNQQVYQDTIHPVVRQMARAPTNQSACVFTYGHTGSGKTHSMLGYDDEMGLYKYAAHDLLQQLQHQKDHHDDDEDDDGNNNNKRLLLVRVTELYKDQIKDLITGSTECSIRQDGTGIVQVRGPMWEDDQGRIHQVPLGQVCATAAEAIACVETACASRHVGVSTHHDQSSRSHLVVEFEVVTAALMEQRKLYQTQDAQLTRLKWLQTERMFGKHRDRPFPLWTQEYTTVASKLRNEIKHYEELVPQTKQQLARLEQDLGGTLVFCDLAGNEYARDAADSTKVELEEAAGINRNLLAVKEMLRKLSRNAASTNTTSRSQTTKTKKNHVPYRDSKLSMMLRRHLDHKAVMLAHLSPSVESLRKTINTLNYSSMVGQAKNTSSSTTTPSSSTKNGKENKQSGQ